MERLLHKVAAVLVSPRVLIRASIAGLLAIASGCVEAVIDTDCVDTLDRKFVVSTPADPALQFRVDRCHVDVAACPDLCRLTMERNDIMNETPTRCEVAFFESSVDVKISYEVYVGGNNCPGEPIFSPPPVIERTGELADPPADAPPLLNTSAARGPDALRDLVSLVSDPPWMHGGRTCHA